MENELEANEIQDIASPGCYTAWARADQHIYWSNDRTERTRWAVKLSTGESSMNMKATRDGGMEKRGKSWIALRCLTSSPQV